MTTSLRRATATVRLVARQAQCCCANQSRNFSSTFRRHEGDDIRPQSSKSADNHLRRLFDENLPRYVRSTKDLEGLPEGWQESLDSVEADIDADEADYEDVFRQGLGDREEERFDITEHEAAGLVDEQNLEREPRWAEGFWALDEERDDPGEDPEFENDDITSTAHGELEQHREMREYARIMAWDMPLLYSRVSLHLPEDLCVMGATTRTMADIELDHIQPFQAPTAAQPLRFRYTTYLGEEHPAARKVVLTFSPQALPDLTEVQTNKLIKLLGVRYNPSTKSAKISCELHPTPAQNKRYLGDLLEKLLTEARDGEDTFEDVPFDFRHHKPREEHLFPEEWKMTEERRQALEARRKEKASLEFNRMTDGRLVEGTKLIEELLAPKPKAEKQPVMMVAGMDQKGGPQKRRITRQR